MDDIFLHLLKTEHIFLILRFITLITCIMGFFLYSYWWYKIGEASWLYKYIMLLFAGEASVHSIDLYIAYILSTGRILTTIEHIIYNNRMDLRFLFFILVVGNSYYRFFKGE